MGQSKLGSDGWIEKDIAAHLIDGKTCTLHNLNASESIYADVLYSYPTENNQSAIMTIERPKALDIDKFRKDFGSWVLEFDKQTYSIVDVINMNTKSVGLNLKLRPSSTSKTPSDVLMVEGLTPSYLSLLRSLEATAKAFEASDEKSYQNMASITRKTMDYIRDLESRMKTLMKDFNVMARELERRPDLDLPDVFEKEASKRGYEVTEKVALDEEFQ